MSWRIRPFAAAADRAPVRLLWRAAMPPSWPVLPAAIAQLGQGLVAEAGAVPVGFAALDPAGSIPLILVDPGYQRRGIGTGLLEAAMQRIGAGTASSVTAGSGGAAYIWPGVPRDLPAAVRFFASRGWRHTHDTLDLMTDLAGYRPPPGHAGRAARSGVTITLAAGDDLAAVRAFEAAVFPSWARWFAAARPEHILLARTRFGAIAGTLLLEGPGADTVLTPMLGPAAGTIGPGQAPRLPGHAGDRSSGQYHQKAPGCRRLPASKPAAPDDRTCCCPVYHAALAAKRDRLPWTTRAHARRSGRRSLCAG